MKNKKIIWGLSILLMSWGILAFFGIFDFIPKGEVSFMEATMSDNHELQYFILTNFKTDGAFISGKPIEIHIELTKLSKNQPASDNYEVQLGGSETYFYPKISRNGLFSSPRINLKKSEENKWEGSVTAVFDQPGEFPIYTWIKNPESVIVGTSSKSINIEQRSTWLSVLQNRRIFALTLILVAFGLVGLISRNKKP